MKKIISAALITVMLWSAAALCASASTGTASFDQDGQGSIQVEYTTSESYSLNVPPEIELGAVNESISADILVEDIVISYWHKIVISVASQNGYYIRYGSKYEAEYSLIYGEAQRAIAAGTTKPVDIGEALWNEPDGAECPISFKRIGEVVNAGTYTDVLTFSASLERMEGLPQMSQKAFSTTDYDMGEGSVMSIATEITKESEFNGYIEDLKAAGYDYYTGNAIGSNRYATLTNETEIVNVMYIDAYDEIRVVCDSRREFDLPQLKEENIYATYASYTPNMTLISGEDIGWPGRMGYVYQLADGSFFVIDGGYTDGTGSARLKPYLDAAGISTGGNSAAPYIFDVLEQYAPDPSNIVIAAWLITHMHEDHFGAFIDMGLSSEYEEYRSKITIEKLIYNSSSEENILRLNTPEDTAKGTKQLAWTELFHTAVNEGWRGRIRSKIKAHPGQEFYLRNLSLTVYTTEDLLHLRNFDAYAGGKYINNTSIVTMLDFMGKKILHMADSSAANNPYVLAPIYKETLKADVLQVAHHGYGDTEAGTVYAYVKPELVLWPTNAHHFYGYDIGYIEGGTAYSGTKEVPFNQALFADGVKHFIHGRCNLTVTDFENWTVTPIDELQVYDKDTWVADVNYMTSNSYPAH